MPRLNKFTFNINHLNNSFQGGISIIDDFIGIAITMIRKKLTINYKEENQKNQ
jgi:hypothetical protein